MMFNIICFDKFLERFFSRSYTFGHFWLSVLEGHFFEQNLEENIDKKYIIIRWWLNGIFLSELSKGLRFNLFSADELNPLFDYTRIHTSWVLFGVHLKETFLALEAAALDEFTGLADQDHANNELFGVDKTLDTQDVIFIIKNELFFLQVSFVIILDSHESALDLLVLFG